ncbi:hypothetical protein [Serinicoccus kebangsaanensis]|uniref:hypothetical protein n=1 Tax=Serinicoccus kebangsaanensis TaxID=2602069 RepID=UPI00192DC975|nr:hypothetical protein [Serinicoccus kebangsaanensis]
MNARGRGPTRPPMPILGEDRPDVEDTTARELQRRQQAAEEELAARQAEADRQLRTRQAALDRAERRLVERHGRSSVERELDLAQQERHSGIRGSVVALWAWGAGLALLVLGVVISGPDRGPADLEEIATTDRARVAWLGVAVAADEAWALTATGEDVVAGSGAPGDTTSLAEQASALRGGYEPLQQVSEATFDGRTAPPASAAAGESWDEVHTTALGVVPQDAVADLYDARGGPDAVALGALALGGAGLGVALVVALRRRAGWQAVAAGGAVVLAVLTVVQVATQAPARYADAAGHQAAQLALTGLVTGLHDEVSTLLDGPGASPSTAVERTGEGRQRFDEAAARVADERDGMLTALDEAGGATAPVAATGLGAAALGGVAFALPGRRKDR